MLATSVLTSSTSSQGDIEAVDWVALLAEGSAEANRPVILRLTITLTAMRTKLLRVVQPLCLQRLNCRRTRGGSSIDPPPQPEDCDAESVEMWVDDFTNSVKFLVTEMLGLVDVLDDVLKSLDFDTVGRLPCQTKAHPDENDWSTYMVRRAATAILEQLQEQIEMVPEIMAYLTGDEANEDLQSPRPLICFVRTPSSYLMPQAWNLVASSCLFRLVLAQ